MKFAVALLIIGVWMESTISSEAAAGVRLPGSNPGINAAESEGIHRVKRQVVNATSDVAGVQGGGGSDNSGESGESGSNSRKKCLDKCFAKDKWGNQPACTPDWWACQNANKSEKELKECIIKSASNKTCCECISTYNEECCKRKTKHVCTDGTEAVEVEVFEDDAAPLDEAPAL